MKKRVRKKNEKNPKIDMYFLSPTRPPNLKKKRKKKIQNRYVFSLPRPPTQICEHQRKLERGKSAENALLGKNVPCGLSASFIVAVNSCLRKMLQKSETALTLRYDVRGKSHV